MRLNLTAIPLLFAAAVIVLLVVVAAGRVLDHSPISGHNVVPPTVGGVLASLNLNYPGIRFRIVDEQGRCVRTSSCSSAATRRAISPRRSRRARR
jgi:uncharacterized membrane protein